VFNRVRSRWFPGIYSRQRFGAPIAFTTSLLASQVGYQIFSHLISPLNIRSTRISENISGTLSEYPKLSFHCTVFIFAWEAVNRERAALVTLVTIAPGLRFANSVGGGGLKGTPFSAASEQSCCSTTQFESRVETNSSCRDVTSQAGICEYNVHLFRWSAASCDAEMSTEQYLISQIRTGQATESPSLFVRFCAKPNRG
jgi:hypothetical protein